MNGFDFVVEEFDLDCYVVGIGGEDFDDVVMYLEGVMVKVDVVVFVLYFDELL